MNTYPELFVAEEILLTVLPALVSGLPSMLFGIASYVLSSMALYTLAVRRGLRKAWLSWIPVINVWILGSLSDQYRYVVKGQYRSKRKVLLVLNLLTALMGTVAVVLAAVQVANLFSASFFAVDMKVAGNAATMVLTAVCLALPMAGIALTAVMIRYMALYDVYTSMDPNNNVLFLVLSILFHVTEPFFLFFSRNKDGGMPPRKPRAAASDAVFHEPEPMPDEEESYM